MARIHNKYAFIINQFWSRSGSWKAHPITDPDPWRQIISDPTGSGNTADNHFVRLNFWFWIKIAHFNKFHFWFRIMIRHFSGYYFWISEFLTSHFKNIPYRISRSSYNIPKCISSGLSSTYIWVRIQSNPILKPLNILLKISRKEPIVPIKE